VDNEFESADWFKAIGGILFLIGALMPWWEFELDSGFGTSKNGLDYVVTGIVPFVIFTGIALLTIIIKTDSLPLPGWLVDPLLQLGLAVVGAVLVGVRFFWSDKDGLDSSRGLGLYLAAAAVVLALIGCVMGLRERAEDDYELASDDGYDTERVRRRAGPPIP
jgi:hypothetical protein